MEEFELDTDVLHELLRAIGTKHLSGNPKTWIGNPWDDVDDI